MRRRSKERVGFVNFQDPGKDLFAYLFLMVMIFSLLLLRTAEEQIADLSGNKSPRQIEPAGQSSLREVSIDNLGRLGRRQGEVILLFGNAGYHPRTDGGRLLADGRITPMTDEAGREKKILYLEEGQGGDILLNEYLKAFAELSRQGIEVVFVDRVM